MDLFDSDVMVNLHFVNDDRKQLENLVGVDQILSFVLRDDSGEEHDLKFQVTRNRHFNENDYVIYGHVLNSPGKWYYQLEFRMNKEKPETDTIVIFCRAAPIQY